MRKIKRVILILIPAVLIMSIITGGSCSNRVRFGALPEGEDLARSKKSPNWRDGAFRNIEATELFAANASRASALWEFIFAPKKHKYPIQPIPAVKTNLKMIAPERDVIVWLGHSSLYLQLSGKRILIDPVFSDYAAPFSMFNRAFRAEYVYNAEDMPEIDVLAISHDHWDHLDYPTIMALKKKVKNIVCPLGVGSHLRYWGIEPGIIHEEDWEGKYQPTPDLTIHILPSRHFSGRGLKSNQTLWAGFLFDTPGRRVFFSGDGGYGKHFARIGEQFPGIDIALMEAGQYNKKWPNVHMTPEEAMRGAQDLKAKRILPVHSGRFCISDHAWYEPYQRLEAVTAQVGAPAMLTPRIGEIVFSADKEQKFSRWWLGVEPQKAAIRSH